MPVPAVVFYISGHGFGHASRQVEVLNALAAARPDLALVLRTAVSPVLLNRTLRTPVTLLDGPCDTGVIQRNSLTHDDAATVQAALAFQSTYPARLRDEADRLAAYDVRAVVGDIPPLAFDVAAATGAPSLAIANFTWDWIYEWYLDANPALHAMLDQMRASYRRAGLALELPLSGGFDVFPLVRRIPFIARRSTRPRTATRHHLRLDQSRPVALLSFGGYGLSQLDVSRIDCLDEWTILTTDRTIGPGSVQPEQVRYIPEAAFADDLRYEDLVAASDVVITKPGYGIISECVAHGTALLYTSRGRFREYDRMVEELPSLLRCRFIHQDDVFAGRWRASLDALLAQSRVEPGVSTDGARVAAGAIQEAVGAYSARGSRSSAS